MILKNMDKKDFQMEQLRIACLTRASFGVQIEDYNYGSVHLMSQDSFPSQDICNIAQKKVPNRIWPEGGGDLLEDNKKLYITPYLWSSS